MTQNWNSDEPRWIFICFRRWRITQVLLALTIKNSLQLVGMLICLLSIPAMRGFKETIIGEETITDEQRSHTFHASIHDTSITSVLALIVLVQAVVTIGLWVAYIKKHHMFLWPVIVKESLIAILAIGFIIAGVVWYMTGGMIEQEENTGIKAKYFYPLLFAVFAIFVASVFQGVVLHTYYQAYKYFWEKRTDLDAIGTHETKASLMHHKQPASNPNMDLDTCKKEVV